MQNEWKRSLIFQFEFKFLLEEVNFSFKARQRSHDDVRMPFYKIAHVYLIFTALFYYYIDLSFKQVLLVLKGEFGTGI